MFQVDIELDKIIKQALHDKISDIHFHPEETYLSVRFRIDGLLQTIMIIEKIDQEKMINRIKILSSLDIGEKRVPQDGRWLWKNGQDKVQLRVSTLPTIWGETIVLRLTGVEAAHLTCADLGMTEEVEVYIHQMLARPYGLLLVSGPTGSGKSSTLYALLRALNDGCKNLICLENPVECSIPGLNQVQINEKAGLTFATGLRAVLRQDPDVIMVGEIRDKETAQLAVQAALTGHFVLSTIHTNHAAAAVERLLDMGVEDFLVKSVLVGVIAQRLIRKPCICKGEGCEICKMSGYKGRLAIFEVLYVPRSGLDFDNIHSYLQCTLEEEGKKAVLRGDTTYEELKRLGVGE